MRRLADRTTSRSKSNGRVIHDFTRYYFQLQWLSLANGNIEIAHHFPDVRLGDRIKWGASIAVALTYRVVRVTSQPDLLDLWFAEAERITPAITVMGRLITSENKNKPSIITRK